MLQIPIGHKRWKSDRSHQPNEMAENKINKINENEINLQSLAFSSQKSSIKVQFMLESCAGGWSMLNADYCCYTLLDATANSMLCVCRVVGLAGVVRCLLMIFDFVMLLAVRFFSLRIFFFVFCFWFVHHDCLSCIN